MSIAKITKINSQITKITITKADGQTIELPVPRHATLTFEVNGSAVVEEFRDRFHEELNSSFNFGVAERERLRIENLKRIQDFLDMGAISEQEAQRLRDGLETGTDVVIEGDRRTEIDRINLGMMTVDEVRQSRFSDRPSMRHNHIVGRHLPNIDQNSSAEEIRHCLEMAPHFFGFKRVVGNPMCKFNACEPTLRCAVNPCGPCEGCQDFESR